MLDGINSAVFNQISGGIVGTMAGIPNLPDVGTLGRVVCMTYVRNKAAVISFVCTTWCHRQVWYGISVLTITFSLGFGTTANKLSFFMNLALRLPQLELEQRQKRMKMFFALTLIGFHSSTATTHYF